MEPARPMHQPVRATERKVLEIVRTFVAELGTLEPAPEVHLASLLEDDLGIYSLERLELILRLEQGCGVDLGDDAIIDAATVADLAAVVMGHRPSAGERVPATGGAPAVEAPQAGSFLFTAYVGLLLLPIGAAAWLLLRILPAGPRAARMLKRAAGILFRAAGCRIELDGGHHLQDIAPPVLVANHQSYLDSLVLLAALPVLPNIVVNERLPGAPLVGPGVRAARFLPADRTSIAGRLKCADGMVAALSAGEALLVFPEATFDGGPGLLPFRLGAFSAAAATGRPVVPITLRGTRRMLPSGSRLLRRGRLSITIHPPIYPRGRGWEEALRLRTETRQQIARAARSLE
jgi:fatty-acyl-CoA synthase